MKVDALRSELRSGGNSYPVFVTFLRAKDLLALAEVPSFDKGKPHERIATDVLLPPVTDWQRPLDGQRVTTIKELFSRSGEIMPNPVLVSENLSLQTSGISIRPTTTRGGVPTGTYELSIPKRTDRKKALWILDGQHRINGLAASAQGANPIPTVLLLGQDGAVYMPREIAKIFAQVTTEAKSLSKLHNEWLTFVFDLGDYEHSDANRDAMQTVAHLCSTQSLGGVANPFHNKIQFNEDVEAAHAVGGGFRYDCIDLRKIWARSYYESAKPGSYLSPDQLAEQVVLAYEALRTVVSNHSTSVFLGDKPYEQRIMQDAFLHGVCACLLAHETPASWEDLLRALAFDKTDWNFAAWITSLSGPAQTISKKIAENCFDQIFRDASLPEGVTDIADFLKGDEAVFQLVLSKLTPKGRQSKKGRERIDIRPGGSKTVTLKSEQGHVSIQAKTPNVGKIVVTDRDAPRGQADPIPGMKRNAVVVKPPLTPPMRMVVTLHFYGGDRKSGDVTVKW